jgi:hypothetical protein
MKNIIEHKLKTNFGSFEDSAASALGRGGGCNTLHAVILPTYRSKHQKDLFEERNGMCNTQTKNGVAPVAEPSFLG